MEIKRTTVDPETMLAMHEIFMPRAKGYALLMAMGRAFPPIVTMPDGNGGYEVVDGFHRLTAAALCGKEMEAWEIDGDDFEDMCMRFREDGRHPDAMLIAMCAEMD